MVGFRLDLGEETDGVSLLVIFHGHHWQEVDLTERYSELGVRAHLSQR